MILLKKYLVVLFIIKIVYNQKCLVKKENEYFEFEFDKISEMENISVYIIPKIKFTRSPNILYRLSIFSNITGIQNHICSNLGFDRTVANGYNCPIGKDGNKILIFQMTNKKNKIEKKLQKNILKLF